MAGKGFQCLHSLGREFRDSFGFQTGFYRTHILQFGIGFHSFQGGFAQSSLRHIDYAVEGLSVFGVVDQLEVSNHVFDFLPVVESGAAHHYIRNVASHQDFFYGPRLRVGAVENDAFGEFSTPSPRSLQFFGNIKSFVYFVLGFIAVDFAALAAVAAQYFVDALGVIGDDAVGCFQDSRS
ncbi:MAG: hypothetical protein BWY75_02822 [bacterium ADurb.Bin425]|nr:MAG: hypothetical protein BWY75_02822 [bacterium ADurb.Bin425]